MAPKLLPLRIASPLARPRPQSSACRLPLLQKQQQQQQQQQRTFLDSLRQAVFADPNKPAHIHVSRTLPHGSWDLYTLIADVDSYRHFVPYCTASRVTRWTAPDARGARWPAEADLTVGAFGFTQTYTSRLRCVPGVSVEALSGADALPSKSEPGEEAAVAAGSHNGVFKSLITKWTVTPVEKAPGGGDKEWTAVDLSILFHLADPVHQIALSSVSEEQGRRMIAAFEQRARERFGGKRS